MIHRLPLHQGRLLLWWLASSQLSDLIVQVMYHIICSLELLCHHVVHVVNVLSNLPVSSITLLCVTLSTASVANGWLHPIAIHIDNYLAGTTILGTGLWGSNVSNELLIIVVHSNELKIRHFHLLYIIYNKYIPIE
jgi:hypothetical protein